MKVTNDRGYKEFTPEILDKKRMREIDTKVKNAGIETNYSARVRYLTLVDWIHTHNPKVKIKISDCSTYKDSKAGGFGGRIRREGTVEYAGYKITVGDKYSFETNETYRTTLDFVRYLSEFLPEKVREKLRR